MSPPHVNPPNLLPTGPFSTNGSQIVDQNGNAVRICSIGWDWYQGLGTTPNGLNQWSYKTVFQTIINGGFNCVRICTDDISFKQNQNLNGISSSLNPDIAGKTFQQALLTVVNYGGTLGLKFIIESHQNEGTNNVNSGAQQPNGLWYDIGGASNGTDGGGNTGNFTDAQFLATWQSRATLFKNNLAVIGYDLKNEPLQNGISSPACSWGAYAPGGGAATVGSNTDIRSMYQRVGNAIQAIDSTKLIICEGTQNYNGTYAGAPGVIAPWGDLTGVTNYPVVLTTSNKVVYSVHVYPNEVAGTPLPDNGSDYWQDLYNAFGFVVAQNIAPVWIGEMGDNMVSSDAVAWCNDFIKWLNGNSTGGGKLTFTNTQQGVSWSWWVLDLVQGGNANFGILASASSLDSTQKTYYQQLLPWSVAQNPVPITAPLSGTVSRGSWVVNQRLNVSAMPNGFMQYNYLLPQGYSTANTYPLMFYGHENTEGVDGNSYPSDGGGLVNQTVIDGSFNTVAFRKNYPCIVVVPECDQSDGTQGTGENFGGYNDTPNGGGNEQGINALAQYFIANFSVDTTRLYCTGDSLGAIGTLAWMVDNNAYGTGTSTKLWAAGMGFSDQLYRPNVGGGSNNGAFTAMKNVPYIAVSTPNDNNEQIYDMAGWTFYTGNSNFPSPATYNASGTTNIQAPGTQFYYIRTTTDVPWDTYRQLNADGGNGTALYNLLFSFTSTGQVTGGGGSGGGGGGGDGGGGTFTPSPNNSVVIYPSTTALTDSQGNQWTITSDQLVFENGAAAGFSQNVTEIAFVSNVIWQENTSNDWYSWAGNGVWNGPFTSPLPTGSAPLSIGVNTITVTDSSSTFTVSGSLTNFPSVQQLDYQDDGGTLKKLPAGNTTTQTSYSFTHPAISAGNHLLNIVLASNTSVQSGNVLYTVPAVGGGSNGSSNIGNTAGFRLWYNQPGSNTSYWNTPFCSNAQFSVVTDAMTTDLRHSNYINAGSFGASIGVGVSTDPLITFTATSNSAMERDGSLTAQIHVPLNTKVTPPKVTQTTTALTNWYENPGADGRFWKLPFYTGANWITSGNLVTLLRNGSNGSPTGHVHLVNDFSVPWVIGKASDPIVTITDGTRSMQFHVPLGTIQEQPITGTDNGIGGADITQPYKCWSAETATINTGTVQQSGTVINCNQLVIDDATGPIMEDIITGQPGTGNMFGTIQEFELLKAIADPNYVIPHMLAYELDPNDCSRTGPIWPLYIIDASFPNNGNLPQGLTIGIPASTPRPTGKSRGFYLLWDSLQQFGWFFYNVSGNGCLSLGCYSASSATASLAQDIANSINGVMPSICILNYANGVAGAQYSLDTVKGKTPGATLAFPAPPPLDLSPTNYVVPTPTFIPSGYSTIVETATIPSTSNGYSANISGTMTLFDQTQPYKSWTFGPCVTNDGGNTITSSTHSITAVFGETDDGSGTMEDQTTGNFGYDLAPGVLRLAELQQIASNANYVIQHSLSFETDPKYIRKPTAWNNFTTIDPQSPYGLPYIAWPQTHTETTNITPFAGHIPFGATVGIPPGVAMPSGLTAGGQILWKNAQQYGWVLRGIGTAGVTLISEPSAEGNAILTQMRQDLNTIVGSLCVLVNQKGPSSRKGGGTPLYQSPMPLFIIGQSNPSNTAQIVNVSVPNAIQSNTFFNVTGTLANYTSTPVLSYQDDGGSTLPLTAGSVVSTTAFSFTHPGVNPGVHTTTITDGNGGSNFVTYTVSGPVTPSAPVYLISPTGTTQTFTAPQNWNSLNNTIEAIGGGGGSANAKYKTAGGGGAYAKVNNLSLTAGQQVSYQIGAAGSGGITGSNGGNSWFFNTGVLFAPGGKGGSTTSGGQGGQASQAIGNIKFSGGSAPSGIAPYGAQGGGGAAGPRGPGATGGQGGSANSGGGGGGGSSDGGSAGFSGNSVGPGGQGGTSFTGQAGGIGGTLLIQTGSAGTVGSGGGGSFGFANSNTSSSNSGGGGNGAIQTTDVINFFNSIAGTHTVSCQFIEEGTDSTLGFASIQAIKNNTGFWLGMIGGDYWHFGSTGAPQTDWNQYAIQYWQAGGLVTLIASMPNPTTTAQGNPGYSGDTSTIDAAGIIQNGNATNTQFKQFLDQIAAGIAQLQASGVIVIWRPFHEMNGNWFWWGAGLFSAAQFIALWKYTYNYMTVTKGLKNIVWLWSINAGFNLGGRTLTDCYPGSGFVDMVGFDLYTSDPGGDGQPTYAALGAFGKPICLAEFGSGGPSAGDTSFDERTLITAISNQMPNLVFWQQWWDGNGGGPGWGFAEVQQVQAALSTNRVYNRGQFALTGSGGTSTVPAQAANVGYNSVTFGPNLVLGKTPDPVTSYPQFTNSVNIVPFTFYGTSWTNVGSVQNPDGSITMDGTGQTFGNGLSLAASGNANQTTNRLNFTGIAFGGGFYIEAAMKGTGPMSFWLNDLETMNGVSVNAGPNAWPGQASGYGDWIEVDIAEFDTTNSYGIALHNWYNTVGSNVQTNTNFNKVTPSPTPDYTQYHNYGCLWVPATSSSQGRVEYYYDGTMVARVTWNKYNSGSAPPPVDNGTNSGSNPQTSGGNSAYSVIDNLHMVVICGGSPGSTTTFKSISVWQKDGTGNLIGNNTNSPTQGGALPSGGLVQTISQNFVSPGGAGGNGNYWDTAHGAGGGGGGAGGASSISTGGQGGTGGFYGGGAGGSSGSSTGASAGPGIIVMTSVPQSSGIAWIDDIVFDIFTSGF